MEAYIPQYAANEIAAKFSGGRWAYVRYALLLHLPSVWMRESSMPADAAVLTV